MTELAEPIAILTLSSSELKCPFCDSKAEASKVTKTLENDSAVLAKNMGGMPERLFRHPHLVHAKAKIKGVVDPLSSKPEVSTRTSFASHELEAFEVVDAYYRSDNVSALCLNAHHVIPGNASLANAPELLQWMADTVVVKKIDHSEAIERKALQVSAKDREAFRAAQYKAKNHTIFGSPDMVVVFSAKLKSGALRTKTVSKSLVEGEISFDINHRRNGEWLPSNTAVVDWSATANLPATDSEGRYRSRTFGAEYALASMRVTKRQFHDSHGKYSNQVKDKLKELAVEVRRLSKECLLHPGTKAKSEDGPFPAPQRLTGALYLLAGVISRERLDLTKKAATGPWVTSRFVTAYGHLI